MHLKKNKIFSFQNILTFSAILISIVSLLISFKSLNITQQSLEINLNPIVSTEFYCNAKDEKYFLKIINDGPVPLNEIKITRDFPVYNLKDINESYGARASIYWWKFDKLLPGDSLKVDIPYEYIKNLPRPLQKKLYPKSLKIDTKYLISALLMKISFRKDPEKTKYFIRKYLFPAIAYSKPGAYDPENDNSKNTLEIMRIINKYESSRNWLAGNMFSF